MPANTAGMVVIQSELANIFGVSVPTVRSWESRGCPVLDRGGKGRPTRFNTADVFRWREQQINLAAAGNIAAMDLADARRRRLIASATLLEIEASLRNGEVVLMDDVVTAVTAEYAIVRNRLLGIGARIAPRAAAAREPEKVKSLIDEEVHRALSELTADAAYQRKQAAQEAA